MSDVLGKVFSVLLCVVLMYIYPLHATREESMQLERMYIYQEAVRFLDSVRNTGKISSEDWILFERKIKNMTGLYEIQLTHEKITGESEQTKVTYDYYYHGQIMEQLELENIYFLGYNDFIKIVITDKNGNMTVCYGGGIKMGGEDETD